MADGTVDNLNIQLSADANKAVQSLNNLKSTLNSISTAFTKDISGMRKFSKEIGTLSASMRSLSKIKFSAPDMSGINKMLKSLNGMDASGAKKTADGIEKVVNSFNKLGNANFNDSGINKTVNALNRLFKVDTSKFNPNDFVRITDSIAQLGTIPDVSSGVNRFVSSLSRLANAGTKTGQSANDILRLGQQTALAARELGSVGVINDDVNLFVQSIGRLASAGSKTGQTASGLSSLSKETLEFFKAMQNAPRVSENTIRMTQALAQLASAGGRVNTATNTVSNAFSKLASVGNKTLSAMKKVSTGIVSAFKNIGNSSGNLTKAQFSLGNLLKTAVAFRLGYGLLNFGKQAFQLGSDITEVENVVNVAFGGMADKAYEFAKTAKEQFGLSELVALKYAGTMRSVLNSSGVEAGMATQMSTDLAGLAGDLASFYNISQDNAWEKIMSGMAGEIEPLRRLGINMSVANMEAYALSQGITESWLSMTQAEQVMLRYNYLMDTTAAQQGDFARTSGTWANQVRLLTLNVQQLASTIGQGLISAVLPAVTALNKLFSVLQKAAVAVRNFFYVLTGYKGGGSSGIVNDITSIGDAASGVEDLGSAGSDAAGGLGEAAKAAEELKNATLGIDELNIISPNEPASTGGSGGSGGGGGAGGIGSGDLGFDDGLLDLGGKDPEKYVSPWAEAIRKAFLAEDWEELGEVIADGLNRGLQKVYDVISWDNVGPKITAFTTAFTETFNSFANAFDFELLGRTIGTGINTIVNTLNQLIDGIDWKNLGRRFAVGFNGLVDEVDWFELGRLIGNKLSLSIDILYGFVSDFNWGKLGLGIGKGINGAIEEISLEDIGTSLGRLVTGLSKSLRNAFSKIKWSDAGKELSNGIINLIKNWDAGITADMFGELIDGILSALTSAIETLQSSDVFYEIGQKVVDFICGINWEDLVWDLTNFFSALGDAITQFPMDFAKGFGTTLLENIFGVDFSEDVKEKINTAFKPAEEVWKILFSGLSPVANVSKIMTLISDTIETSGANILKFLGSIWESIKIIFSPITSWFSEKASSAVSGIKKAFQFLSSWFTENVKNPIVNIASGIGEGIEKALKTAYNTVTSVWKGIKSFFTGIANKAIEPIGKLVNGIISGVNWVSDKLGAGKPLKPWTVPKFAKGTDGLNRDTIGMVNDQKGATYKELILPPNGKPFIPKGRNVMLPLQKGTKIMPAGQTEELMKLMKIPRFAGGIGSFFGNAWESVKKFTGNVMDYFDNPSKLVQIAFDKFIDTSRWGGAIANIGVGVINTIFDSAVEFIKKIFGSNSIEKAVRWAIGIANDNSHGYDQEHRTGPDYDCSSLITIALQKAGLGIGVGTTSTMLSQLLGAGFKNVTSKVNISNGSGMKRGDVLLKPGSHTAMYIGDRKMVHARINEFGGVTGGKTGDQTGNEIAVTSYRNHPWTYVLRFGGRFKDGIGTINISDLFKKIPALAGGGTLMPGQLFVANERGPELIGRYGNRTTVMNNDQVVESVSSGVERAIQRQNDETNALLRQILDYQQRLLAKDTSVNLDGKRTDSLLRRARSNSGYNFRPAGGTV